MSHQKNKIKTAELNSQVQEQVWIIMQFYNRFIRLYLGTLPLHIGLFTLILHSRYYWMLFFHLKLTLSLKFEF